MSGRAKRFRRLLRRHLKKAQASRPGRLAGLAGGRVGQGGCVTPLGVVAIWEGNPGGKLWGLMTPEQFAEFKRRLAEEGL